MDRFSSQFAAAVRRLRGCRATRSPGGNFLRPGPDEATRQHDRVLAEAPTAISQFSIPRSMRLSSPTNSGLFSLSNRAAQSIFGYSAQEAIGRNVRSLMMESERSVHDNCLAAYRGTGERKIIGIGREVIGLRKDGSAVSLDLSVAEWRDIDGQQCFTGIMRNITVRNEQASELQRATEIAEQARIEAEAANSAKTEFLATIKSRNSHAIDEYRPI